MALGLGTMVWAAWASMPLWLHAPATDSSMAVVGPGTFQPLRSLAKPTEVPPFLLDREPVTNGEYLAFVSSHPEYRRDRIDRLFADAGYLSTWAGPADPGVNAPANAPVVRVSWFAAKAYCAARGARLPKVAEWEVAGNASATQKDARNDPAFRREFLSWFERPESGARRLIGGAPNAWGVADMNGLVWEWVFDFNADLVDGDDRGRGDVMRFCGAGAIGAPDPSDAPLFLRTAFRSALHPDSTTNTLGFRCAANVEAR